MNWKLFVIVNIILCSVISNDLMSQNTKTIYFDNQWKQCSKETSSYYRKYHKTESKEYNVQDFYNSGQLQMVGTFKKRNWKEKNGRFIYYYKNGQKKSEVEYVDNKRTGKWTTWHENGNIKSEAEYKNGELISLTKEFDEDGNFLFEYAGDIKLLDNYAEYESSIPDYLKFLKENIHYPEQAKQFNQQGVVFISFFIDENGNVYDTKILRGVSEDIDKEAIRVIKLFKWPKPIYKGKEIILKFNAPVKFTLN